MAGHSKWKNIAHRKGRQDASRGQVFTRLCREVYVAAKRGGANPDVNYALRIALVKARAGSVPNDTLQRTIDKAMGSVAGVVYEEFIYEGYGPGGFAVMLELSSDNRNRTAAEIRHLFAKHGGNLGETGCVAWMFARKGMVSVPKKGLPLSADDLTMTALEAGADDVEETDEELQFYTGPDAIGELEGGLRAAGVEFSGGRVTYVPSVMVQVSGDEEERASTLLSLLEEHDDVQSVYTNAEFAE